jgi:hypothetical protein
VINGRYVMNSKHLFGTDVAKHGYFVFRGSVERFGYYEPACDLVG